MIAMCTVESVEYSFLIYYSVNLRSDVYFFRLVALLHSCFLHSQPCLCSVWRFVFIRAFVVWAVTPACCRATLK